MKEHFDKKGEEMNYSILKNSEYQYIVTIVRAPVGFGNKVDRIRTNNTRINHMYSSEGCYVYEVYGHGAKKTVDEIEKLLV